MSAWVVSKNHINQIMAFAKNTNFAFHHNNQTPTEIGQILWDENLRSVNHRYPTHQQKAQKFTFRSAASVSVVQFLKHLDCLQYQSCETDNYHERPAYTLLERLRKHGISKIVGYDDAEWGD